MDEKLENIDVGGSVLAVNNDGNYRIFTRVDDENWQRVGNQHYFSLDEVKKWAVDWARVVQVGPLNISSKECDTDK